MGKFEARRWLSASILVGALTMGAGAQQVSVNPTRSTSSVEVSSGTAAMTGVVIDAASGRPLASVVVTLQDRRVGVSSRPRVQVTTPTGRFAFLDLPASDAYFLTTAKPGLLDGGHRRSDPRGPTAPLSLEEGQWLGDVRLAMVPAGSISGSVTDEGNEPIVGVYVRVLSYVLIAGRAQWLAGAVARTDDRGAYRIAGLGPGRYAVSVPSVQATLPVSADVKPPGASAGTSMADLRVSGDAARAEKLVVDVSDGHQLVVGRHAVPPPPASDGLRAAYPITFFSNVSKPSDATPLDLGVGEERVGIDFQLRPVRTTRVSGRVEGPADAVGNLPLRLIPVGLEELGQGSEAATTVTLPDGRFSFLDVPTGSYVLDARHLVLQFTHTSLDDVATAVPAPVAFPAQNAAAGGVAAASPGVGFSSLRDGAWPAYWAQLRVDVSERAIDDSRPASPAPGGPEWPVRMGTRREAG